MSDEDARLVPNTLGVRCVADELRVVYTADALAEALTDAERRALPVTVIGGGSNLVLPAALPGLVVLLRLRGSTFARLGKATWRVTAAAGETWHELVRATLGRGIRGLENLALIPGSVGAAPVQNIGAYGRELAQVLETVTAFDRRRGAFRTLTRDECGLGYRDSRFRRDHGRFVIVRLALRLGDTPLAADYPDIRRELRCRPPGRLDAVAVAEAVARVRRRKLPDPRRVGNVGSFFKNPIVSPTLLASLRGRVAVDAFPAPDRPGHFKISAARLVDAAGWKGVRRGPMQVWPRQPLVLVNRGGATGQDALNLAAAIRGEVRDKHGVELEIEPRVLAGPRLGPSGSAGRRLA